MSKEERLEAEKIDFLNARFYIKAEGATRAAFITERYTATVTGTVLSCAFVMIMCICIIICMPGILEGIDNLLGSINK
jgi:hypothetical protein